MSITHIYLSPHLDDAALSCGGTIWGQTEAGEHVIVINVFAGTPDYGQLSAFAREKHATWGSPTDVVSARRTEDQAALTMLRAEGIDWDYLDAIYRVDGARALYPSEANIFGAVDPADADLRKQVEEDVKAVLSQARGTACYAPLGFGNHVDHQIMRDVGLALVDRGRRVTFYEDFPYVWWEAQANQVGETTALPTSDKAGPLTLPLPSHVEGLGEWTPDVHAIDVEQKISAVACYKSQISDLFGTREAMAEAVREYAGSVSGDHYAERFWRLNDE